MEKTIPGIKKNSTLIELLNQHKLSIIIKCCLFWLIFLGLLFMGGSFLVPLFKKDWSRLMFGIVGTIAAVITIILFLKIDKTSFREIWLEFKTSSVSRFISGYLVGTIIFAIMIGILILFSDLELHKNKSFVFTPAIVLSYLAIIPLGMMEELAFRSYTFVKLNKSYNFRVTQFVTAIAFAAYHMIGGQEILGSLLGPGVWAYVFGLATIRYGGIAMPLGLHVALNINQEFAGLKGKNDAVLLLDYNNLQPASNAISKAETIGIIMHIMVLIIAVVLTEFYIRKKEKNLSI